MLLFLLERPEPIDRASIIAVVLLIKLGELFLPFRLGLPERRIRVYMSSAITGKT